MLGTIQCKLCKLKAGMEECSQTDRQRDLPMVEEVDYPAAPRTAAQLFLRAQVATQLESDPRDYWSFYSNVVDARQAWEWLKRSRRTRHKGRSRWMNPGSTGLRGRR